MLTGLGLSLLPTIWAFRSNLVPIKGTLRAADTYVTRVSDWRRHESRKSELIFYLNGRQQKFYLAENIGAEWRHERFEKMVQGLKSAGTITVCVKKRDLNKYEPEVFQIDNDRTTILDFETVRTGKSLLTAVMLILGTGSVAAFLWFRFGYLLIKTE